MAQWQHGANQTSRRYLTPDAIHDIDMSVSGFITNVPLSPAVTGALLYALTRAPERYRRPLVERFAHYFSSKNVNRAITSLKWLCALGLARNLHIWLSELAQNNFRLRSERHRYNWPNEVAVVTGAASGFGALIAKGLAARGVNVMAVDVKSEYPDDMKLHPRIQHYKCDITDRAAVMELAERIKRQYGDPSILVNNAGVLYQHTIFDTSETALHRTFDVNIISHYWTLQAFLPAMIANKKGHVVSLASLASFLSSPGWLPYCNTKAAVLSLHDGLQAEMRALYDAPEIKFTSVHPTFADTPMMAPFKSKDGNNGGILDPNTVANAVVNQILSGRGKQLIIGNVAWLAGIRGWPHWLSQTLLHAGDAQSRVVQKGKETTSG